MMGTVVLDSEGLSAIVNKDRWVMSQVTVARQDGMRVMTSAATLVEARDPRVNQARFDWAVSRLEVMPVTEAIARSASRLLAERGMYGHQHAIDAMLAATAIEAPGPRTVFTSDPKDMDKLCGKSVRVVGI